MTRAAALRHRSRAAIIAALAGGCWAAGSPTAAQDNAPLGTNPWARMGTVLEKTIFRIDVLRIRLCFDQETADELERIASSGTMDEELGDSIARTALQGALASAQVEFLRDVSLERFLEGVDDEQKRAVSSGFLSDSTRRAIRSSLPRWFAFLQQRGIRKGDRILYRLEPQAIRSRFIGHDGVLLMDRTDSGRLRRNSVLATWLGRGSSVRQGLLRSLGRPVTDALWEC